jgi:hypothetical protein
MYREPIVYRLDEKHPGLGFGIAHFAIPEDGGRILGDLRSAIIARQSPSGQTQQSTITRRKLCQAILKERPGIGIYDILDELKRRGCHFTARNPVNSVRTTLYRSTEFMCENGLFRLRQS